MSRKAKRDAAPKSTVKKNSPVPRKSNGKKRPTSTFSSTSGGTATLDRPVETIEPSAVQPSPVQEIIDAPIMRVTPEPSAEPAIEAAIELSFQSEIEPAVEAVIEPAFEPTVGISSETLFDDSIEQQPVNSETLSSLLAAAHDSDADIAREAVTCIGLLGDASAVSAIESIVRNCDGYFHPVVRAAAASTLGQLRDLRVIPALIDAISDPVAEVSAESIRALAVLGDDRAVAPLIAAVRNVNGYYRPIARRAAVLALGRIGGEQAFAELIAVADDESEDPVIRDAAKQA